MAVPKRKTSKARKNSRRSSVWKLNQPALQKCPNCGAYNLHNRVCSECGQKDGKEVIVVKD
ncbi:MAG: 50S ribosomal protein L32 [Clostridia bacterium]|nr:50S ribosomal protein L32 [Clostridia bacterium]